MSSNATLALALRDEPQAVMLTNAQLNVIANTEFVPKSMRGNVPKVMACVARGRAMGIPDAVALGGIDIIEGKATLSAELMCAIVRRHGHSIVGEVTADRAVLRGKRADNGDEMTAEFNRDMAETAGLLNKQNWKRHPDDMMYARAVSKLCRRLFADCFAGGTYAPEDMQPTADETMDGDWEVVDHGALAESEGKEEVHGERAGSNHVSDTSGSASAYDKFKEWVTEHGVTGDQGQEVMAELYPGRSAKDLTDAELLDLTSELSQRFLQQVIV